MKRHRRQPDPMPGKSLRLPSALWRKIQWRAAETGQPEAEVLRTLIGDALRDQLPPAAPESPVPMGTDARRRRWEKVASHRNQSVEEFTGWLLDGAADKYLGENA